MRDKQHGGMMPLIAGSIVVLGVLAFGGITFARVVMTRAEAQRAVDAAVLAATGAIRVDGLPFDLAKQSAAEEVARRNSSLPLAFTWTVNEAPDTVTIACTATTHMAAPAMVWKSGGVDITTTATAIEPQRTLDNAEKKYPKLTLVLDYSGSMTKRLDGSWPNGDDPNSSYHVLLRATNLLLDKNYNIKYGLVIFATTIVDSVPIALGNIDTIRQHVNAPQPCPLGANCQTDSWDAIDKARQLFEDVANDEAEYVLFVSDGEPGNGNITGVPAITATQAEVAKLWDRGVWMFTVHVVNTQGAYANTLKAFMTSISGTPDDRGDPNFYGDATSEDKLKKLFAKFGAAIACQIGPLSPLPPAGKPIHVFVREGANDVVLTDASRVPSGPASNPGDLWDEEDHPEFFNGSYFFYDTTHGTIFVTPHICDLVTDGKDPVIIRYAAPKLTE